MFGFLRKYYAADETIKRLETELEFHRRQAEVLDSKLSEAESRLRREIDSNRFREDSMKNILVELVGTRQQVAQRAPLNTLTAAEREEKETRPVYDPTEELVKEVADQFVEQAAERGAVYTEEDYEILKARIRENPDEYIYN